MRWRLIGPFRGGRAIAVTGVPGKPYQYYFGAVGGGVWKTLNAGRTWEPIFDGEPISSIGAIAVAPSDPRIIYVGSGEADMRSDISYGDGVYKSTDGGATWTNVGLRNTEQIGRVLVDPHDANLVLVAALGHGYGPNPERGVYRSTDGGANWTKVLSKNDDTGAIDLASDPANARIVYASVWQARRPPWTSYPPTAGPGSGLYKSADGGATWTQIVGHGFPSDGLGRIGIAVAPGGNGNRIYAIVDAREGGLYRSDDAGRTWRRVSSDTRIWQRGWYFGGVTADSRDPNVVYVPNVSLYRSTDGGENFTAIKGAPGGDDYHQLWIAPDDPQRMVLGSDQGVVVSLDGGATWSSWYNQPTAQIYHLTTDHRFPYRVYGTQQDSGTVSVLSRSDYGQITFRDWSPVGAEESGYIALDSSNPEVVYGGGPFGGLSRFDWTTGQSANIAPWPGFAPGNKLRFNWNAPLVTSPQDPRVLYFAAQYVFRTGDGGMSWQTISPDLTKRPAATRPSANQKSNQKDRGVVYTIAPSPVRAGEIWTGSDNGVIQITTDEGKDWNDVTPAGLPDWSMVSLIEASRYDAATAYAAVDRHQVDDFRPYIYRTHDSGKTWQNVVAGLPDRSYVHVVREDPKRKGLLFAGTETGIFTSFDDGDHWQPIQLNLPVSPIYDIAIHGDDLAVATHGRSFWILDDIEPLREWSVKTAASDACLFHPANAYRIRRSENHDTPLPPETPVGQNPPAGAIIDYQLQSNVSGEVALEIRDSKGDLVRRFSSSDTPAAPEGSLQFSSYWLPKPQVLSNAAGMHRFVWDLRYAQPVALHYEYSMGALIHGGTQAEPQGPLVLPGEYEVRLVAGNRTYKQTFTVVMDPRVRVSQADLQKQLDFELNLDATLTKATRAQEEVQGFRATLDALRKQLPQSSHSKDLADSLEQADKHAGSIAGSEGEYPPTSVGIGGISGALTALAASAGTADSAPTAQSLAAFAEFKKLLDENLAGWETLKRQDVPALNQKLKTAGIAPIAIGDGNSQ